MYTLKRSGKVKTGDPYQKALIYPMSTKVRALPENKESAVGFED